MNKRFIRFITVLLLFCTLAPLLAVGIPEVSETSDLALSAADVRGVTVTLDHAPKRLVSLSPNITETLFALGLGEYIVGRTDYCDYPLAALQIESVGDVLSPSIEKIVSLNPDLVIMGNKGQAHIALALEQAHIRAAVFDEEQTMEGTYTLIRKVGNLTGAVEESQTLIKTMQQEVQQAFQLVSNGPKPTLYYVTGFGEWGDFTATGDTYIHDIIELAGARNIAKDGTNWTFQLEQLLISDPDIIIVAPMWQASEQETIQAFVTHPSYASLTAIQTGNVISFADSLLERQGPRSSLAVLTLARYISSFYR
ncbi:MAG: ABC transporter substrate-binding protein [Sphaerochaetaceae bacterium]|jgi:iron complex transport system substrate-binding protein